MPGVVSDIAEDFIGRQSVIISSSFLFRSLSSFFDLAFSQTFYLIWFLHPILFSLSLSLSLPLLLSFFPLAGNRSGLRCRIVSYHVVHVVSIFRLGTQRRNAALPYGSSQARQRSSLGGAPHTGGPAPAPNQPFPESPSRRLPQFLDRPFSFLRLARLLASSLVRWIRLPLVPIPYRQPAPPYHWEAHPEPACLAEWKRHAVRRRAVRNLHDLVTRQR
jgi:hypothetical protein